MTTTRLESFSDGVLAVAITLLVLDLNVPHSDLAHALRTQWPEYAAYVTSFLTVGIIWINHHVMIGRLRAVDHAVMFLNLLLLMSVVVIPFSTNLMAEYLRARTGEHLAAAVYGGSLLAMGLSFGAMHRYILLGRHDLLAVELPIAQRRRIFARAVSGVTPYVVATAAAPLSPYLTLGITFAVAVFYALPAASTAG
ncbi:MAG TPA: TMEM175 family protein [Solirubrobacteraceae bacterium]|nr:TMEM175 family protein [Solirubrobacteraceae bacterium]